MNTKIIYLIFTILCFAGCMRHIETPPISANLPTQLTTGDSIENTPSKDASIIHAWNIRGLFAARNAKKAWSAQINWQQDGINHYQIRFFGPMGSGTTLISCIGHDVTYQDEHKKITANNASKLMKQQTGISIPVESLYYWIRGLPAKGAITSAKYGLQKQLLTLKQSGYTLTYSDYAVFNGYRLPTKILLQGQGIQLKLIIKSWSINL